MAKKVFIAATKQNDGKTTISLGLIYCLKEKFKKIGFIKPIGQRYLEEDGLKIDEDSVLIEKVLESMTGVRYGLKDMSPVAVEKGFTEKYIANPNKKDLTKKIKESYKHIAGKNDLVVIEGTGHAGVGSVFDHSNAVVAKLLNAKVILISSGGVGRPIDEIILNKALFDKIGVRILGVVINKVLLEKFDKINKLVRSGLKRSGIDVLGVLPYHPELAQPTISQILEETDFKLLSGKENIKNRVLKIVIGAMAPKDAINYFEDKVLIITPGDREDLILTALDFYSKNEKNNLKISGFIFTGNQIPAKEVMDKLNAIKIPVILANTDTYSVSSKIHDMTVKIRPEDKEKIDLVVKLTKQNMDFKKLLKGL